MGTITITLTVLQARIPTALGLRAKANDLSVPNAHQMQMVVRNTIGHTHVGHSTKKRYLNDSEILLATTIRIRIRIRTPNHVQIRPPATKGQTILRIITAHTYPSWPTCLPIRPPGNMWEMTSTGAYQPPRVHPWQVRI